MLHPENIVVHKQFSEEEAGKRVGWVSVQPVEDSDAFQVDVAVATVGEQGAQLAVPQRPTTPMEWTRLTAQRSDIRPLNYGFKRGVALSKIVEPDNPGLSVQESDYTTTRHLTGWGSFNSADIMRDGIHQNVPAEQQLWAEGPEQIRDALKSQLVAHGIDWHYPQFYLWLNQISTHYLVRPNDVEADGLEANPELFLPDPQMQDVTQKEIAIADEIVPRLEAIEVIDKKMLTRINQGWFKSFGREAAAFEKLRQKVAAVEERMRQAQAEMRMSYFVYYPPVNVGHIRGRLMMNPLAEDETKAFGKELKAIEKGDDKYAQQSLAWELERLEDRLEWARYGRFALRELAHHEKIAADN